MRNFRRYIRRATILKATIPAVSLLLFATAGNGAGIYWTGDLDSNFSTVAGGNSNWATDVAGTLDYGMMPQNGDSLLFNGLFGGSSVTRYTAVNDNAALSVSQLIFLPAGGSLGAAMNVTGLGFSLSGGITNFNTRAGRDVTISAPLTLTADQTWSAANDYEGVLIITGGMTGGVTLTLNDPRPNAAQRAPIRLAGNNSAFTGTVTFATDFSGVELLSPSAMPGGVIDLNAGSRTLTIANTGVFTFGIGTGPGSVNFRTSGGGGLFLAGGGASQWDPGAGGDYVWAASGTNHVRLGGNYGGAADYSRLRFGNDAGRLVLSGSTKGFSSGGGASNANAYLTEIRFALADDGTARTLETAVNAILTRAASSPTVGAGAGADSRNRVLGGSLSASDPAQLFPGNLDLNGGTLVLDGVSWAEFTASRPAGYSTSATAEGSWQISSGTGGFAARGDVLVIDESGTTTATFDRDFQLGSFARDTDGSFYANRGVVLARDILLGANANTNVTRAINLAHTGPGLGLPGLHAVIHTLAGNVTDEFTALATGDRGALRVGSGLGQAAAGNVGELVLSGSSYTWAGSASVGNPNNATLTTGPGGLAIGGTGLAAVGFARFATPAALPTHTGVDLGYYMLSSRNGAQGLGGFLFTGTASGATYAIPANVQFLLSGQAENGTAGMLSAATLGVASGSLAATHTVRATLQNAVVNLLTDNRNDTVPGAAAALALFARDGTLALDGVSFRTVRPDTTGLTIPAAAAYTPNTLPGGATALLDHAGMRAIYKRGEGTVVLNAVNYQDATGLPLAVPSSRFSWTIGRDGALSNTIAAPFFDGAVRETATASLADFPLTLQGGVLETNGTFSRSLGTAPGQVKWGTGGGGFAAGGGPLLVQISAGAALAWGAASFIPTNNPLILGSRTADDSTVFANPLDLLATNNAGPITREIRSYDNAASEDDYAAIVGGIGQSGTGTSVASLHLGGDGVLALEGALTYAGTTTIAGGTVRIHGTLSGSTAAVSVLTGATLGGTGIINRPTTIAGTLAPETLDFGSTLDFATGSALRLRLDGRVAATAAITLNGSVSFQLSLGGVVPAPADTFYLLTREDGGAFATKFDALPEGASIALGGEHTGTITYLANWTGDAATSARTGGNDVAVHTIIPEPSTSALALGALAGLLAKRRRQECRRSLARLTPAAP